MVKSKKIQRFGAIALVTVAANIAQVMAADKAATLSPFAQHMLGKQSDITNMLRLSQVPSELPDSGNNKAPSLSGYPAETKSVMEKLGYPLVFDIVQYQLNNQNEQFHKDLAAPRYKAFGEYITALYSSYTNPTPVISSDGFQLLPQLLERTLKFIVKKYDEVKSNPSDKDTQMISGEAHSLVYLLTAAGIMERTMHNAAQGWQKTLNENIGLEETKSQQERDLNQSVTTHSNDVLAQTKLQHEITLAALSKIQQDIAQQKKSLQDQINLLVGGLCLPNEVSLSSWGWSFLTSEHPNTSLNKTKIWPLVQPEDFNRVYGFFKFSLEEYVKSNHKVASTDVKGLLKIIFKPATPTVVKTEAEIPRTQQANIVAPVAAEAEKPQAPQANNAAPVTVEAEKPKAQEVNNVVPVIVEAEKPQAQPANIVVPVKEETKKPQTQPANNIFPVTVEAEKAQPQPANNIAPVTAEKPKAQNSSGVRAGVVKPQRPHRKTREASNSTAVKTDAGNPQNQQENNTKQPPSSKGTTNIAKTR